MKIEVFPRLSHGEKRFFPADRETCKMISRLTGKEALTKEQVETLIQIGHKVVEVPDPQFVLNWA